MKLTNKSHVEKLLMQIQRAQSHIKAVEAAVWACREIKRHSDPDCGSLLASLHAIEMDAWRNLAMWGLTLDDAERDRIKAAAYDRFLRDGLSVAHHLSDDGTLPGQWLAADEDEFRAMARKAFGPKEQAA